MFVGFARQSALKLLVLLDAGETKVYTNVNLAAPLGVLLFLGTGFLLFVAAVALVYSVMAKKFRLTKLLLITATVLSGLYLGAMLIFSSASSDRVLARGEEKYFCEIDCHLAYSVVDVRHPESLDEWANPPIASGVFWGVVVKTRFDENTIGSTRGNEILYPNSRIITVVDGNGRTYYPFRFAPRTLIRFKDNHTSETEPLRPGESYTSTFVFDLPKDVLNPTLLIREGEFVTHFIIGHENSLFHKKVRFQIL